MIMACHLDKLGDPKSLHFHGRMGHLDDTPVNSYCLRGLRILGAIRIEGCECASCWLIQRIVTTRDGKIKYY
jgi:hypothetical protein